MGGFKFFVINKSYEDAKAHKANLETKHAEAGKALNAFPKGPMGITPEHVKASPEFKLAKAHFDTVHDQLRKYNTVFLKQFAKQYKAERK